MDLFYFFLLGFIYYILFIIWDFFKLIVILEYNSFKSFCCGFFDKINKKFGYCFFKLYKYFYYFRLYRYCNLKYLEE